MKLDNDGFLIVDAILTNLGRKRLAEGNGVLPIRKYAFGDAEINYNLYDVDDPTTSEATISLTPISEASPDESTALKYKLIGNIDKKIAYLPTLDVNTNSNTVWGKPTLSNITTASGSYYGILANVFASQDPNIVFHTTLNGNLLTGYIDGTSAQNAANDLIRIDQGINSNAKGEKGSALDESLVETQFYIKMDSKFGRVVSKEGVYVDSGLNSNLENVDSDYVATYSFSIPNDPEFFSSPPPKGFTDILGPVSRQFVFSIAASDFLLNNYSYAFPVYGDLYLTDATYNYYKIETFIEIIGNTFGRYVKLPVSFAAAIPL